LQRDVDYKNIHHGTACTKSDLGTPLNTVGTVLIYELALPCKTTDEPCYCSSVDPGRKDFTIVGS